MVISTESYRGAKWGFFFADGKNLYLPSLRNTSLPILASLTFARNVVIIDSAKKNISLLSISPGKDIKKVESGVSIEWLALINRAGFVGTRHYKQCHNMQKEERLQTGHDTSGRPGNAQLSMLMVRGLGR